MNNLSSYCGLDDTRISASDKDLPLMATSVRLEDCEPKRASQGTVISLFIQFMLGRALL